MMATYFAWQIKPGREAEFKRLWSAGTEALRGEGSLGSALFESGDGQFHAFARWPDRATRDTAFAKNMRPDIFGPMAACILETRVRQDMELVEDQWVKVE
jgi:hypothetical protein